MGGRGLTVKMEGLDELIAGLKRVDKKLQDVLVDALAGDAGEVIRDNARFRINSKTGATASGVRVERNGGGAEVGFDNPQGTWLESGTAPHIIEPRSGKALYFGGRAVEKSIHPGIKPQRIMSKSLTASRAEVETVILRDIGRLIDRDLLAARL